MLKREQKLNEKDLKKYLNNYGIAKQLKFYAGLLLMKSKKFRLKLNYGGGSYTDGDAITIGVPSFLVNKTKTQILSTLKAMTAHEMEHINITPFKEWEKGIEEIATYFKDKHDIDERIGKKVGHYLVNSIEDGRIERHLANRNPVAQKHLVYFRSLWWQNNAVEGKDELFDTLFCLCTFATMGLFPKNYADCYDDKDELFEMIKKVKRPVINFVDENDFNKAMTYTWEIIHLIEDWMVELMKQMNPEDLEEKLDEANSGFGEISSDSGSSANSGGNSNSGSNNGGSNNGGSKNSGSNNGGSNDKSGNNGGNDDKNNAMHNAFDGLGKNSMDSEEEVISDRSMDEIVKSAIKESEETIAEEEYENIIQADFDDMMEQKRIKEEEAKQEGLSEDDKEEILDYYRNLDTSNRDGDWDVPLKFHKNKYNTKDAPQSIKLEAKKMEKEFKSILINKKAQSVRNKRRGKLDTNSLWKLQQRDYRLFEKKSAPNNTDYVFYLLVDGSGSMSDANKFIEAYRATALVEESLKKIVPLKIVQFDCGDCINHYIVKDFDNNEGNKSWTFVNKAHPRNCNMDGYSVRVALTELKKRKEKKKVLIVLSDGQPNGCGSYYGGRAERDVKEAIRSGRKDGVSIFNIMFGSERQREQLIESFKFMYENGIISCSPENIGRELLRIVKRELV